MKGSSVSWSSRFLILNLDTKKKRRHGIKARSHLASTYAFEFSKIIEAMVTKNANAKIRFCANSLWQRQHHHRDNVKIWRKR